VTPLAVVALFKGYGVGGVLALMIGLLVVQIIVVWAWGIEPARRGLEHLFGTAA
jgi:putative MFS transporter